MKYPNLSQATYDRLTEREEKNEPQTRLDVADLIEAYESACILLDNFFTKNRSVAENEAAEFLYTEQGDPRVDLWEDE